MSNERRPELKLLVESVSAELNGERIEEDLHTDEDFDWAFLRRAAHRHGVVPVVHRSLSDVESDSVPAHHLEHLTRDVQRNSRRNLYLTSELLDLLDAFDDQGIRILPYKGPVLARDVYGDVNRREFTDLDLLVDRNDLPRAGNLLISQGYSPRTDRWSAIDQALIGNEGVIDPPWELRFRNENSGETVELHWQIGRTRRLCGLTFEDAWQRRREIRLAGRSVQALSNEHRVIALSRHATKHGWRRLEWLRDIAAIVQQDIELDWKWIYERAAELSVETELEVGLQLAVALFDVRGPPTTGVSAGRSISHRTTSVLVNQLIAVLVRWAARNQQDLSPEVLRIARAEHSVEAVVEAVIENYYDGFSNPEVDWLRSLVFDLRTCERPSETLSILRCEFLTPDVDDYRNVPLPRGLHPLYYLFPPLKSLKSYLSSVLFR